MGSNWLQANGAPTFGALWQRVSTNADGRVMIAGSANAGIWYSTDTGESWLRANDIPTRGQSWLSICTNADGSVMIAGSYLNDIWYSTDTGHSWTRANIPTKEACTWYCVNTSADGHVMIGGSSSSIWYSRLGGQRCFVTKYLSISEIKEGDMIPEPQKAAKSCKKF